MIHDAKYNIHKIIMIKNQSFYHIIMITQNEILSVDVIKESILFLHCPEKYYSKLLFNLIN